MFNDTRIITDSCKMLIFLTPLLLYIYYMALYWKNFPLHPL